MLVLCEIKERERGEVNDIFYQNWNYICVKVGDFMIGKKII